LLDAPDGRGTGSGSDANDSTAWRSAVLTLLMLAAPALEAELTLYDAPVRHHIQWTGSAKVSSSATVEEMRAQQV